MKKYLFIALAALGFAACAEKLDDNSPVHNGELEESYIAINLMSADVDTRAATDSYGYEEGTTAERAVKSAYFFFFDENGNPFNVTGSPVTAPGEVQNGKNHLILSISNASTSGMPNVSDIKDAILVLKTYKGVYPSKIVAVLNWVPENKPYSLTDLHEALEAIGDDTNGYVMSNSVYMDGANKMIDAVPLTAANIKTTEAEALAAPINIYVERTAAKVVLTAGGKIAGTDNIFDTQKNSTPVGLVGGSSDLDVYVKLNGWELYNDYSTSSLLKNIENWDVTTLGLTWNDIPYYRCYWAKSQAGNHSDSFAWSYTDADKATKGFQTNYGFAVADAGDNYATRSTYTYCGENTNQVDGSTDPRTKVILKGQLMQKKGGVYEPLELARWYGTEYAGDENLRIAVANSLKYTLYSSENGQTFSSITPDDIQCVEGIEAAGAKAYEVSFQLSTAGAAKKWYQYNSTSGYVVFGDNAITGDNTLKANEYLETVEPALLYTDGQTYYHVDIKHLGSAGKTAEYGVVRNHVYQIDIETIKGYGSPVYTSLDYIVDVPEYPIEDDGSYVAAKINILSWKVVKQGVNIVQ